MKPISRFACMLKEIGTVLQVLPTPKPTLEQQQKDARHQQLQQLLPRRTKANMQGAAQHSHEHKRSIHNLRPGQRLAANLFKGSLLFVTVPVAGHILTEHLIVTYILRGIKSENPYILKLTLQRAKGYLFCEYLANRFEEEEGVMVLSDMLNEHARMPADIAIPYLECLAHLAQFQSTKGAMLMLGVVERLEQALQGGWLPKEARPLANALYLDLHAARRMAVEEEFGSASAGKLALPTIFHT